MSLLNRVNKGLEKSRRSFAGRISALFSAGELNDNFYEELEELLISGDVGVSTSIDMVELLRKKIKNEKVRLKKEVFPRLQQLLVAELEGEKEIVFPPQPPAVIIVLGVNGVGKTTTIGKLSYMYSEQGKKVILAAGDTFRAAAIEQLQIWADRAHVDLISHQEGSDPAAVIFDGVNAAVARRADVLICDTAGRLHTKKNLMDELKKIIKVADKALPGSPHEILLVVDATTGQNALAQAKLFNEAAPLTGLVVTKLDGTARGGILLAVRKQLGVPIKFIGVGEDAEDLQPFDAEVFVHALLGNVL